MLKTFRINCYFLNFNCNSFFFYSPHSFPTSSVRLLFIFPIFVKAAGGRGVAVREQCGTCGVLKSQWWTVLRTTLRCQARPRTFRIHRRTRTDPLLVWEESYTTAAAVQLLPQTERRKKADVTVAIQ